MTSLTIHDQEIFCCKQNPVEFCSNTPDHAQLPNEKLESTESFDLSYASIYFCHKKMLETLRIKVRFCYESFSPFYNT